MDRDVNPSEINQCLCHSSTELGCTHLKDQSMFMSFKHRTGMLRTSKISQCLCHSNTEQVGEHNFLCLKKVDMQENSLEDECHTPG